MVGVDVVRALGATEVARDVYSEVPHCAGNHPLRGPPISGVSDRQGWQEAQNRVDFVLGLHSRSPLVVVIVRGMSLGSGSPHGVQAGPADSHQGRDAYAILATSKNATNAGLGRKILNPGGLVA